MEKEPFIAALHIRCVLQQDLDGFDVSDLPKGLPASCGLTFLSEGFIVNDPSKRAQTGPIGYIYRERENQILQKSNPQT